MKLGIGIVVKLFEGVEIVKKASSAGLSGVCAIAPKKFCVNYEVVAQFSGDIVLC